MKSPPPVGFADIVDGGAVVKLSEVRRILQAEVLSGEELLDAVEALSACGADLMSDVLAFTKERTLLCTGLTNTQVVRTAELIDLCGLVFVRGKRPPAEVVAMAAEQIGRASCRERL